MKVVYLLIGPKGAGKSYIGRLMKKELGIAFLSVEEFFIRNLSNPKEFNEKENIKVWQEIEDAIDKKLKKVDKISLESVGLFDSFQNFFKRIDAKYKVNLIKIETPLELCYQRIAGRDIEKHVKFSRENTQKINELSIQGKYKFNLVIPNSKISNTEIIKRIKKITV